MKVVRRGIEDEIAGSNNGMKEQPPISVVENREEHENEYEEKPLSAATKVGNSRYGRQTAKCHSQL